MLLPALFIGVEALLLGVEALLVGAEELKLGIALLGADALGAEGQGDELLDAELQGAEAWWINWLIVSKMDADIITAMIPIRTVLYFPNIVVTDVYLIYCFVSSFILLQQEYSYQDVKIAII